MALVALVLYPLMGTSQAGRDTLTSNYVIAVTNWLNGQDSVAKRQLLAMPERSDSAEKMSAWTLLLDEYYFWPGDYQRYLDTADSLHIATSFYNVAKLLVQQPPQQYVLRNDSLSVPIRLRNKAHPVVELRINGRLCRLLLDTGAQRTVLARRFVKRLKTKKLADLTITNYNSRNVPGSLFVADSLILDNLTVRNLPVLEASMPFRNIDGLLGWDILRQFAVTIDYVNQRFALRRSTRTPNHKVNLLGGSLPMLLAYGPTNNQLNLMLDTGANNDLAVSPTGLTKMGPHRTKRRLAFSSAVGELIRIRPERFVKEVRVQFDGSSHSFKQAAVFHTDVVVGQVIRDGLLGSRAFRQGTLRLDAPNHWFSYQDRLKPGK